MKTHVWERSLARYVVPDLPGSWSIVGGLLYREPSDWLLCYLSLHNWPWGTNFSVYLGVQLLAAPATSLRGPLGRELGHANGKSFWPSPKTIKDAEPAMQEILQQIHTDALPFFDEVGNLPGYRIGAEERARRQPDDVYFQETVFCLRLLDGDVDSAIRAAEATARAASREDAPWAAEIARWVTDAAQVAAQNRQEALNLLRRNADTTRTNLGLPMQRDASA
ncbi:MAG: hypothetical protein V7603_6662 [Micromonosporaceae bacterium]